MRRRDLLRLGGSVALGRLAAGCDRLVVLDPRLNPELPPITPIGDFYVYSYAAIPDFDPETHATSIASEAGPLATFDAAFLRSLPARDKEHTLQCIGSRPRIQHVGNAIWSGLPLVEVLDALGVVPPASAVGLRVTGLDGYHAGIPIADLWDGPIWLVWQMNGEPLPTAHGAPARLLVPGRYGVKNLKWLAEIAFVDQPHVSYWTDRGWSEEAVYRPNTFVASPIDGFQLAAGERVRFVGTAHAGRDPVVAVDVSVDGGPCEPADLDYATGEPDLWVLWSWPWTPGEEGDHRVRVRCTTASGARSVDDPDGTDPFQGYDGSMEIAVRVRR